MMSSNQICKMLRKIKPFISHTVDGRWTKLAVFSDTALKEILNRSEFWFCFLFSLYTMVPKWHREPWNYITIEGKYCRSECAFMEVSSWEEIVCILTIIISWWALRYQRCNTQFHYNYCFQRLTESFLGRNSIRRYRWRSYLNQLIVCDYRNTAVPLIINQSW